MPASNYEVALARVPFFHGLTPDALRLIAQVTAEETHGFGAKIFQYGDRGDRAFVLLEGKVRISCDVADVGEQTIALLGTGEVFGEMCLLDEAPRLADARAEPHCRLLVLSKDAFDDLLLLHKDLAYEILWSSVLIISARLREATEKMPAPTIRSRF
jgi:CRP/FNR family transcriptional regulator, cyclic AMP receptor protein